MLCLDDGRLRFFGRHVQAFGQLVDRQPATKRSCRLNKTSLANEFCFTTSCLPSHGPEVQRSHEKELEKPGSLSFLWQLGASDLQGLAMSIDGGLEFYSRKPRTRSSPDRGRGFRTPRMLIRCRCWCIPKSCPAEGWKLKQSRSSAVMRCSTDLKMCLTREA